MAYSHFTYERVRNELGIQDVYNQLFPQIIPIFPSEHLTNSLLEAEEVAFFSEKYIIGS